MHVSGMSFLNERFLRFVLIVWSLYIRVSITSIVFLMGSLMNNDLVSKDTHTHTHTDIYISILNLQLCSFNGCF